MFCRGRGESMDFQSQPTEISVVRAWWCKADIAISPDPYILSMAQCSGRGACGFVLVGYTEVSRTHSVTSGLPLAKIGSASREMHESGASLYLRRFRFGGEKGAAGVCRGCGEPMEIQSISYLARNNDCR